MSLRSITFNVFSIYLILYCAILHENPTETPIPPLNKINGTNGTKNLG